MTTETPVKKAVEKDTKKKEKDGTCQLIYFAIVSYVNRRGESGGYN